MQEGPPVRRAFSRLTASEEEPEEGKLSNASGGGGWPPAVTSLSARYGPWFRRWPGAD